jgi:hypothetical protein
MPTIEPYDPKFMSGTTDATMEDIHTIPPMIVDPRNGGTTPYLPRAFDQGYMHPVMYPPPIPYPPAGPAQYPGNGTTGAYANGHNIQPLNPAYAKIESVNDLVSPDSLEFEFRPELDAVLHVGKCHECVQFGLHLIMPATRDKFLRATAAHSDLGLTPLRNEITKLTKTIGELKDALQSSQNSAASRKEQRDKANRDYDELLMEHRTIQQRVKDLEQQVSAASHRRSHSPARGSRYRSPTRTGTRSNTPYERPTTRRTVQNPRNRAHANAPTRLEPVGDGDVIMAAMPTGIRTIFMHEIQPDIITRAHVPPPTIAGNLTRAPT